MIKLDRNTIQQGNCSLKTLDDKYFRIFSSAFKERDKIEYLNFADEDFLGLNQRFKKENLNYKTPIDNVSQLCSSVALSLQKVFDGKVLLVEDESFVYTIILQNLINENDFVILDEFANPSMKIAVKNADNSGIPSKIIQNNNLENLEEIIINRKNKPGKIWFVGQSIYPVPGKFVQLQTLKKLLQKYRQLHLFLDDSNTLGWFGSRGQGVVCSTLKDMQRVVMIAALTKGFGAIGGAIVASGVNSDRLGIGISQRDFLFDNLNRILHTSELFLNDEVSSLQVQLRSRINYFHRLVKGHLPCISDPSLPICFIETYLPEISHEICSSLLKRKIYVSSAIYPYSSVYQPGIRINITLRHSEKEIRELVRALKDVYKDILKNFRIYKLIK